VESVFWDVVDALVWARWHWRPVAVVVAAVVGLTGYACSQLTWVYRLTTKDGEAVRVGIAKFGGYHRRMRDYRKGKDSSTRKGDPWQRRVRWWTPTIPARVARWCGCTASSATGEAHLGWSRWFRTVELHRTRPRAKRYETVQITTIQPRHNHQENPLHRRRRKVAA
jgi:hypothetical protein